MQHRKFVFRLQFFFSLTFFAAVCLGQNDTPPNALLPPQKQQQIVLNVPVESAIAADETQTFALRLESGQLAVLVLEQKGIDAVIALDEANGGGKRLLEVNANEDNFGGERLFFRNEGAPRDLLVRVFPADKAETRAGKFSLALAELKTADARDELRLAAQKEFLAASKLASDDKTEVQRQARSLGETSLKLARQSGDRTLEGEILLLLQRTSNQIGDNKKAVEYGENSLGLYAVQDNLYGRAKTKYFMGYALVNAGEPVRALPLLSEARAVQRETGDRKSEAFTLIAAALAYSVMGDSAKAGENAAAAFRAAKEISDKEAQIQALILSSRAFKAQSEFARALEDLNAALPLAQETDSSVITNIYSELGATAAALGQQQKALDYNLQTLALARERGFSKFNEAIALSNIASDYLGLRQFDRALDYHAQAARIFDEIGSKPAIIGSLTSKGAIYYASKDYPKAKQAFTAALKYAEENNLRVDAGTISANLALTEMRLNEPQRAIEHFHKSIEIRREAKNKRLEAVSLSSLAEAYIDFGQNDQAAEAAAQSLEMTRAVGDRLTESDALYHLARATRARGDLPAALSQIGDSLKIVESLRSELINQASRAAFFSRVRGKYDLYIQLLIELQSKPENKDFGARAFAASENARARSLLDLIAESNIDVSGGINPALKAREQDVFAKLSALQTQLLRLKSAPKPDEKRLAELVSQIEKTDNEREQLESEIRRANPRYAELKYPATLDLAQTQALLDEKTVLLEYQTGGDASYLFAIGKKEFQIVALPKDRILRDSIESLRRSLTAPTRTGVANYLVNGRGLYQTLLAPIENLLKTKTKIIVSADGALNYLPFEVLLRNNANANLDKLPYLVRDFEISYTPSASILANLKSPDNAVTTKPSKSFLAFAAPDYGAKAANQNRLVSQTTRNVLGENRSWNLTDLQNAKAEAERIARLFPAGQATVFAADQATEERAKTNELLGEYRYLHFAVHGMINEEQPQFSSLVLSLPKTDEQSKIQNPKSKIEEDGLLQTPEIFNLRLRADLVTLSACETGLGQEMRGEGIVGLTRAFFYAGTPSLLVSLWKVDDASTAELMTFFYEQLRKTGGRDKASALREAQLKMIAANRYAHPYYWASFVLQGRSGGAAFR